MSKELPTVKKTIKIKKTTKIKRKIFELIISISPRFFLIFILLKTASVILNPIKESNNPPIISVKKWAPTTTRLNPITPAQKK